MDTAGNLPADRTTNVSETVTRLISRRARRGVPAVVGGNLVSGSTDLAGEVTGVDSAVGTTVTVTYANPYQPPAPVVIISPSSANISDAAKAEFYVSSRSTTEFTVSTAATAIMNASFTYIVYETGFINPPSTKLR